MSRFVVALTIASEAVFFAAGFCILALMEWIGYLTRIPRQPIALTCAALVAIAFAAWRFVETRRRVEQLRLGRDGRKRDAKSEQARLALERHIAAHDR